MRAFEFDHNLCAFTASVLASEVRRGGLDFPVDALSTTTRDARMAQDELPGVGHDGAAFLRNCASVHFIHCGFVAICLLVE